MQMISGLLDARYFGKSCFVMTARIPFTFHEDINNLSGVFPDPYYHLLTLVFIYPTSPWDDENCFDFDLVTCGS